MTNFKLSGEVIEEIITIIQQGILAEQDITPDLRDLRVEPEGSSLVLSEASDNHFSDVVFVRVGQIVNEAWITGTNIADHLRMMVLEADGDAFTLTNEYMGLVETNLRQQAEDIKGLKEKRAEEIAEAKPYDFDKDPPSIVRGEN